MAHSEGHPELYVPVKPFYDDLDDQAADTFDTAYSDLKLLEDRSLITQVSGIGGLDAFDARVTPYAISLIEKMRSARADKRERRVAGRDAMVAWLYSRDATSPGSQPVRDTMLDDVHHGYWLAERFSPGDLSGAAAWLRRQGLADGVMVDEDEGPVRLYLTDSGITCAEEFQADTTRYLQSQRTSGSALPVSGGGRFQIAGHAFLSYVRQDAQAVDRLQGVLEAAGIRIWRDTADLWPGEDWRARIRRAITDDALAFIACFSDNSVSRQRSYQNEELTLAVEQLRQRKPDDPWLIPVRFDDCNIPDLDIGRGRTLASIQRVDLFGSSYGENAKRLVEAVRRILGPGAATPPGPALAVHSRVAVDIAIGEPDATDLAFNPPVRSVVHVRVSEPISDLTASYVTDQNLGGTTDLGHGPIHVSTRMWRIRSDFQLRSVRDVIIGYTIIAAGNKVQRFQWDGHDHAYDWSRPGADGSHLSALQQIKQAIRARQDSDRQENAAAIKQPQNPPISGRETPRPAIPCQLTQHAIPLSDGLRAGTLLAIEVKAHQELDHATVLMTGITGPPQAVTIPPPIRLYWHPARQVSATIAQGASNLINVARAGPLPTSALMETPDQRLPWSLPDGQWRVELQLTAKGHPALFITATFDVSPADGIPVQDLEWLTLTTS